MSFGWALGIDGLIVGIEWDAVGWRLGIGWRRAHYRGRRHLVVDSGPWHSAGIVLDGRVGGTGGHE